MAVSRPTLIAIIANVFIFLLTVTFSLLSTRKSAIFPTATGAGKTTEITPSASTFTLWAFIYLYQAVWIIYTLSLLWRGVGSILPVWFYWSYSLANVSNICWMVVWARSHFSLAFAILALITISLGISLFFAFTGLRRYLDTFPNTESLPNRIDVWCVRLLVQNGVVFYTAWVSIATCLNLCIVLQYELHMGASTAAISVLAVLFIITILWFIVENFVLEEYTRYVVVEYVILLIGLGGILGRHWKDGNGSVIFVLALLILSAVLLLARSALIFQKENRSLNNGISLKYIVRR